jgi:hypothetical protein
MNMTGSIPNNNLINGLPNFNNQNQHYMLGGASVNHGMSGASGISGLSGGGISSHTAGNIGGKPG